jgi:hypothetical protein
VCPFHGYRVGLGTPGPSGFCAAEYPVLTVGGLVFVRFGDGPDLGFPERMSELERSRFIYPGFELSIEAPHELVIENVYDGEHFSAVHQMKNHPRIVTSVGERGELIGEGVLQLRAPSKQADGLQASIKSWAYSPGVVVVEMGGAQPYGIVLSATPAVTGCVLRHTLTFAQAPGAPPPPPERCEKIKDAALVGVLQDKVVWEGLSIGHANRYTESDKAVLAFQQFLSNFSKRCDKVP